MGVIESERLKYDIEQKKLNVREHTYSNYECHVRRNLKPFFGNTNIKKLNYASIVKFITHENKNDVSIHQPRLQKLGLSPPGDRFHFQCL